MALGVTYGTRFRYDHAMRERELQANVQELCTWLGLRFFHVHDSRRSQPGFPDLVIVGAGRVIFRELKAKGGRISPEQRDWIKDLNDAGADVRVWYVADWQAGTIRKELTALKG